MRLAWERRGGYYPKPELPLYKLVVFLPMLGNDLSFVAMPITVDGGLGEDMGAGFGLFALALAVFLVAVQRVERPGGPDETNGGIVLDETEGGYPCCGDGQIAPIVLGFLGIIVLSGGR